MAVVCAASSPGRQKPLSRYPNFGPGVSSAWPRRGFSRRVGCIFDDRPYGEGLKFPDWMERLVYYYVGRFAADVAPLSSRRT